MNEMYLVRMKFVFIRVTTSPIMAFLVENKYLIRTIGQCEMNFEYKISLRSLTIFLMNISNFNELS